MQPSATRLCVIINKGGGSVGGRNPCAALEAIFARHGLQADIHLCSGDELEDTARHALARTGPGKDYDGILAGGGDGTINAVAGVLAHTGLPLGVLPLGTLNHFAKDLGLPLDLDGAVGVIAAGHTRRVDVGEVNGQVFVNNSSLGLYATMVAERDRQRRRAGRGKWPAMVWACLRTALRFPLRHLTVSAEGWTRRYKTPLIFIGNNAYEVSLPRPGTRAVLDDGRLCLFIARPRRLLGLLRVAVRAMFGRLKEERDFESYLISEVRITAHSAWLRVSVDGEVTPMRPPLRYRIHPGALVVYAPPKAGSAL
ncbi:putative lipid kinase [Acetobacteraceae bacterium AT-5844]|nr:putative lipid kinase [Acetobacteraceae bacterium AT-5844]